MRKPSTCHLEREQAKTIEYRFCEAKEPKQGVDRAEQAQAKGYDYATRVVAKRSRRRVEGERAKMVEYRFCEAKEPKQGVDGAEQAQAKGYDYATRVGPGRSEPMRVQVSEGNEEISYDFWIAF